MNISCLTSKRDVVSRMLLRRLAEFVGKANEGCICVAESNKEGETSAEDGRKDSFTAALGSSVSGGDEFCWVMQLAKDSNNMADENGL